MIMWPLSMFSQHDFSWLMLSVGHEYDEWRQHPYLSYNIFIHQQIIPNFYNNFFSNFFSRKKSQQYFLCFFGLFNFFFFRSPLFSCVGLNRSLLFRPAWLNKSIPKINKKRPKTKRKKSGKNFKKIKENFKTYDTLQFYSIKSCKKKLLQTFWLNLPRFRFVGMVLSFGPFFANSGLSMLRSGLLPPPGCFFRRHYHSYHYHSYYQIHALICWNEGERGREWVQ